LKKRQIQTLFTNYAKKAAVKGRSIHSLRHSIAVHRLEAGQGIEYVADHLQRFSLAWRGATKID
jgi:site-specific recombinase XerD